MQELVEDNVQFVEVRAMLPPLYFLNGTTTKGGRETLETYIKVANKFISEHSDHFFAAKYIYSVRRFLPKETMKQKVLDAIDMVERYPNHLIGFDLVGQEDTGRSLFYYIDELLTPKHLGKHLPYIFHAGETDWEGRFIDQNLFDAILLNTSRIGHGYAITKHPTLRKYTKENKVAIELCPISNQILGLVSDLRDHPAADLLSDNQPITVSPDDPAIWQASGVSFDLYQVFMAMTPAHAGLAVLKKLALNSISYSNPNELEKFSLMEMWKQKWEIFLDNIILEYRL
ncbi:adenosine deaminase 2-like [Hydractinia symbiolongicarpus]|uniref:adenosine deaminase 2-like n=1 Tax=Hydractinia symbiolongicarpus TaxID=13093 RepID=UPI00254A7277|nr:adenosine deaminase 2-like [Hydractinia symbiolongicarpus]